VVNLKVKIGKMELKNPVMVASGTFGEEYGELIDINSLGAYVAKTITLEPRVGNPAPRIAETASGMLNSIGLENKGFEYFAKEKAPFLKKIRTAVVVSIAGDNASEFKELASRVSRLGYVDAIEVNLSCPNVKHGTRHGLIAQDEIATKDVIKAVKKASSVPVIAKLTPNVTDITKIALAAEDAGSDALLLVNTFFGMAVDIDTGKPRLGNITGGLSGPAIKPMVIKMVWETYKKVRIPVIGCGGIMDHKDAIEFMLCGARAIQVGTANFIYPEAALDIIDGIKRYMSEKKISDVRKLTGAIKL
jgi:dihydroorotate dehydrogenase (NAD+) catalytic subunit